MNVLDLFSGIGGFSLGLERVGFETVAFCEINPFCRAVLKKHWPSVPCFDDVRALSAETLAAHGIGAVDLICGGYPCQPFSAAGKRRGQADDRHLWPEMFRLIRELRPTWVIGENVAGHVSLGLDEVLSDLESESYQARAFLIPACGVDAPHRRERVWIVANSNCVGEHGRSCKKGSASRQGKSEMGFEDGERIRHVAGGEGGAVGIASDANRDGLSNRLRPNPGWFEANVSCARKAAAGYCSARWPVEPRVGRVANGIPNRVDCIKSLGNGLVPDFPEIIGEAIKAIQEGLAA